MHDAVHANIAAVDIFIAAAAVADYHAAERHDGKMKKDREELSITLVRNPDILASVAALPKGPFTVGFAAETDNLREYALGKLEAKKLDMIVANLVGPGRGFDTDDNALEVFWPGGERSYARADKRTLARDLLALVAERFRQSVDAESRGELTA